MYGVFNTLSEYTYFCISKKHYFILHLCFLVVSKMVESLQCILNVEQERFLNVPSIMYLLKLKNLCSSF